MEEKDTITEDYVEKNIDEKQWGRISGFKRNTDS